MMHFEAQHTQQELSVIRLVRHFCSAVPDHVGQLQPEGHRTIRHVVGTAPRCRRGAVGGLLLSQRLRRLPRKVESL